MGKIIIRQYNKEDRIAIRKICCDTAFMGEPMEIFFDAREILADIVTLYYTDDEPESTFVAETEGRVIGYLTGARNTRRKRGIFIRRVIPKVFLKFILKRTFLERKTRRFLFNCFRSFLKFEFNLKSYGRDYPADLHINIDKDFRKLGVGSKLMEKYIEYLTSRKIKGVHLSTFSEKAKDFFMKSGFVLLYKKRTSLWRYILGKDTTNYILGKKLEV